MAFVLRNIFVRLKYEIVACNAVNIVKYCSMGTFILCTVNSLLLTSLTWAYIEKSIEGRLPEVEKVKNFLELLIQPYIQPDTRRSYQEDLVDKVITVKINKLKPLLQDNDNIDSADNLRLEGIGETTIIELPPKQVSRQRKHRHKNVNTTELQNENLNVLKKYINRYKKMKKKLIKMLQKELVSKKTEKYVTKSFDQIIQELVKKQCRWKSVDKMEKRRMVNTSHSRLTSDEWREVKMHYGNLLENRNVKEALTFLQQSVNFFSKLSEVFNIKCNVADGEVQNDLRRHSNNNTCGNFVICSQELHEFLKSYYLALNNSAVSAFRNYAEMYRRDVNNNIGLQKGKVVSAVRNVSNTVERIVSKMTRKEIIKLKLDAVRDKETNIRILKDFIKDTGERVKKHVGKHMESDFASLKENIVTNVKKDIDVTLRMDIESIQKEYTDQICMLFAACNGNYIVKSDLRRNSHIDGNSVYVKVQLNFDEDLKKGFGKTEYKIFQR